MLDSKTKTDILIDVTAEPKRHKGNHYLPVTYFTDKGKNTILTKFNLNNERESYPSKLCKSINQTLKVIGYDNLKNKRIEIISTNATLLHNIANEIIEEQPFNEFLFHVVSSNADVKTTFIHRTQLAEIGYIEALHKQGQIPERLQELDAEREAYEARKKLEKIELIKLRKRVDQALKKFFQ